MISSSCKRASFLACCSALAVLGLSTFAAQEAKAMSLVLDFEGLQDLEPVSNFYNGGLGGNGSGPGVNFGVDFSSNALAAIDFDEGGSGNFGGEPSSDTALAFFPGGNITMNVAAGFDTGLSFFYSAPFFTSIVDVYDGIDGTGNILATLNLITSPGADAQDPTGDFSPFIPVGVAFNGTARSVNFTATANQLLLDNITIGAITPVGGRQSVPTPALLPGLIGMGAAAWRKHKSETAAQDV